MLVATEQHRHTWPLAWVVALYRANDGVVRSVRLYEGTHEIVRDPRHLLPLECDVSEDDQQRISDRNPRPAETHTGGDRGEKPNLMGATGRTTTEGPGDEVHQTRPQRQAAQRQRRLMQELKEGLLE